MLSSRVRGIRRGGGAACSIKSRPHWEAGMGTKV